MRCINQSVSTLMLALLLIFGISACSNGNSNTVDEYTNGPTALRHKSGFTWDYFMNKKPTPTTGVPNSLPEQTLDEPETPTAIPQPPSADHVLLTGSLKRKPFPGGVFLLEVYAEGDSMPLSTKNVYQLGYFSIVASKSDAPLSLKVTYTKLSGEPIVKTKELGVVEGTLQDIKIDFSENKKPAKDYVLPADIMESS